MAKRSVMVLFLLVLIVLIMISTRVICPAMVAKSMLPLVMILASIAATVS